MEEKNMKEKSMGPRGLSVKFQIPIPNFQTRYFFGIWGLFDWNLILNPGSTHPKGES